MEIPIQCYDIGKLKVIVKSGVESNVNTDDRQAKSNFIIVHIHVCIKLFEDVKALIIILRKFPFLQKFKSV